MRLKSTTENLSQNAARAVQARPSSGLAEQLGRGSEIGSTYRCTGARFLSFFLFFVLFVFFVVNPDYSRAGDQGTECKNQRRGVSEANSLLGPRFALSMSHGAADEDQDGPRFWTAPWWTKRPGKTGWFWTEVSERYRVTPLCAWSTKVGLFWSTSGKRNEFRLSDAGKRNEFRFTKDPPAAYDGGLFKRRKCL